MTGDSLFWRIVEEFGGETTPNGDLSLKELSNLFPVDAKADSNDRSSSATSLFCVTWMAQWPHTLYMALSPPTSDRLM